MEVIASEQITHDLAWREPGSWWVDPPAGFDQATIAGYQALVDDLNRTGRAGRAGFYFRRAGERARRRAAATNPGVAA
jgi:hypothetical protein